MTIHASQRDVFAFLAGMADESVDCVVTDLPYPTLERHRSKGTTVRLSAAEGADKAGWFGVLSIDQLVSVLGELYRVLRKDSYAFVFVDADTEMLLGATMGVPQALLKLVLENKSSDAPRAGPWSWWPSLTWVKTKNEVCPWCAREPEQPADPAECFCDKPLTWIEDSNLSPGMGYHGRRCTEKILLLEKGKRKLISTKEKPFLNVLCAPKYSVQPPGTTVRATTPKPPSIVRKLVEAATEPGAVVLDPFIGCGTIAEGIVSAGRRAIVNDIDLTLFRDWQKNHFRRAYTEF